MFDLTGKKALITGASGGIGAAIARSFHAQGAVVTLSGTRKDALDALAGELGERAYVVACDLGEPEAAQVLAKEAESAMGGLDILVNCAGIGSGRPIELFDEEMWDVHMDVNLKGTFFTCRAALLALRKSKGNIVNIGSDAGLMGVPGIVAYCASKGGVVNMTKAMALELAPDIRVNCICPGYVDTDMIRRDHIDKKPDPSKAEQGMIDYAPLKRIATPEEIAHAIMYLASHEARFVSGAALPIDGAASAGR